jgi:hypothetical protein
MRRSNGAVICCQAVGRILEMAVEDDKEIARNESGCGENL